MIKNFTPKEYDGVNTLPTYVGNIKSYTLVAKIPGDYEITLAKLTVGDSVSAGNPLAHALFESFTDHGVHAKVVRTRASGHDREFSAVQNAMFAAGIEFHPTLPAPCDVVLMSLGEWIKAQNTDILSCSLVSQSCH